MATDRTGQTTEYGNQNTSQAQENFNDRFQVDIKQTDSPSPEEETTYTPEWDYWHSLYRNIPELRQVIDKLASWTFGRRVLSKDGKPIREDNKNNKKFKKIRGNGKDSPRGVLKNQWRVALICGDSFAEIVTDRQKRLTNLKPLNPKRIQVVYNKAGIIKKYRQLGTNIEWDPEEIYHLSNERIGDETHGIPFPEALEKLIAGRNEALDDLRILYHRNVKPIKFFEVETDDENQLTNVENTINKAYNKSENVVISEGVLKEIKDTSTPQYGTLDSLPYVKFLVRQFVTACGMPEVIMGWGADTTEASASIIYLSYQQTIEDMQQYNEEMIERQLGIELELEFPASLEKAMKENEEKRGKGTTTDPGKDG